MAVNGDQTKQVVVYIDVCNWANTALIKKEVGEVQVGKWIDFYFTFEQDQSETCGAIQYEWHSMNNTYRELS